MHELSVARSLVGAVEDELASRGETRARVKVVAVEVGALSSVDAAALRSAFDVARRHTRLHDAAIDVARVAPVVWCERCQAAGRPTDERRLRCPRCGERCPRLLKGLELGITRIELFPEEETDAHDRDAADHAPHP